MNSYKIHPLAMLFPEMSQKDFEELKASIREKGQQAPIVVHDDMVIDGRNRLRACDELGIAPNILRYDSLPVSVEDFIWTRNMVRRHLSDDQRVVLATQWTEALEKQAKERQAAGKAPAGEITRTPSDDRHATRTAIAKRANVSSEKAKQAMAVKKHAPHLAPKVAAGEMKLRDAAKQAKPAKPASKPPKIDKHRDLSKAAPSPKDAVDKVIDNLTDSIRWTLDDGVSSTGVEAFKMLLADRLEAYAKKLRAERKG